MGLDIEAAFNRADTDHSGFIGKSFNRFDINILIIYNIINVYIIWNQTPPNWWNPCWWQFFETKFFVKLPFNYSLFHPRLWPIMRTVMITVTGWPLQVELNHFNFQWRIDGNVDVFQRPFSSIDHHELKSTNSHWNSYMKVNLKNILNVIFPYLT